MIERDGEPTAAEPSESESEEEAHGGTGSEQSGSSGDAQAGTGETPGIGGYAGRDPATDMPRIPTVPETQEDPKGHHGAPGGEGHDAAPGGGGRERSPNK